MNIPKIYTDTYRAARWYSDPHREKAREILEVEDIPDVLYFVVDEPTEPRNGEKGQWVPVWAWISDEVAHD